MSSLTPLRWGNIISQGTSYTSQGTFRRSLEQGGQKIKVTLEAQTEKELKILMDSVNVNGLACINELVSTFNIGGAGAINKSVNYIPAEEKIILNNKTDQPISLQKSEDHSQLQLERSKEFAAHFKQRITHIDPPLANSAIPDTTVQAQDKPVSIAMTSEKAKLFDVESRIKGAKGKAWSEAYDAGNARDIKETLEELSRIAREEPSPECEYLTNEILAKVLAYKNCHAYLERQKNRNEENLPPMEFDMKVDGALVRYEYKEDVDLLGGLKAQILAPKGPKLSSEGGPLVLFAGTMPYYAGRGSGVTVMDDLNIMGPGDGIARAGSSDLAKALAKYGKRANLFGHSLGGALAIRMSVEMPDLVNEAFAYNAPRQALLTKSHYDALENLHHFIDEKKLCEKWKLTRSQIVQLLNHPSLPLTRSEFFKSTKTIEKNVCNKFLVLLKTKTQSTIDFAEALQLIKFARRIKGWRHRYKVIPEEMPKLHSYIPVMYTKDKEGKDVQTEDFITSLGHDLIGKVYKVHFHFSKRVDEKAAKIIHGKRMFPARIKVEPLTKEKINDMNNRTAKKVGQVALTALIGFPLGALALGGIRLLLGTREHPRFLGKLFHKYKARFGK